MAQLQTAWTLAEHAGNNDLRAWVKGTAALIAEWSTHQRTALDYTKQATGLVPSGETRIRTAAIEARAAARIGDRTTALAALEELQRAREQRRASDGLTRFGGLLTFPEAKQEYYIGGTYALLGDHHEAEQHAAAAIELYEGGPSEQRSYGDEALARLDIVTARIAAGEIEELASNSSPSWNSPRTGGSGRSATPCREWLGFWKTRGSPAAGLPASLQTRPVAIRRSTPERRPSPHDTDGLSRVRRPRCLPDFRIGQPVPHPASQPRYLGVPATG